MESYLIYASNGLSNLTASESYDQSQRPILSQKYSHRRAGREIVWAGLCRTSGPYFSGEWRHSVSGVGDVRLAIVARGWVGGVAPRQLRAGVVSAAVRQRREVPLFRAGFVFLGAVLGTSITWAFLDRAAVADRTVERRALELRAQELSARALALGSPLACLDAVAGENVAAACERALFVSPASVATASSYVAERLALLAAMVAYAERGGDDIDDVLLPLRRSLEADPFGFLAHVLSIRDGCANHNCKSFALLHDASARKPQRKDARSLSRSLSGALGQGARWQPCRCSAGSDRCDPARSAQGHYQRRFPLGGVNPRGQHHESRANRAGPAGRGGRRRCQSEPAVRRRSLVATLAKARGQSRPTNRGSTASFVRNRTDLAGTRPIASAGHHGPWRDRAASA